VVLEDKITALITPSLEALGYELWGIEYLPAGKHSTLRIYLEKPGGVTVDDCAQASHQISAIMDVEEPISNAYMLEVSSPGLDRQLFKPEQYEAYKDGQVQVRTSLPVLGRRKFKGKMLEVTEQGIVVEVDGEEYEIPFDTIEKANVVPEFK
jgi:ribosome maturation factor RimP